MLRENAALVMARIGLVPEPDLGDLAVSQRRHCNAGLSSRSRGLPLLTSYLLIFFFFLFFPPVDTSVPE